MTFDWKAYDQKIHGNPKMPRLRVVVNGHHTYVTDILKENPERADVEEALQAFVKQHPFKNVAAVVYKPGDTQYWWFNASGQVDWADA